VVQELVSRRRKRGKERKTHLVPLIVGVNSDSRVTEKGLGTGGSDDDLLVGALDLVCERSDDTELELLLGVVAGDGEEGATGEDLLVDL
jgi:hypothetical protein